MRITTAKPPEALPDLPISTRWRMCQRGGREKKNLRHFVQEKTFTSCLGLWKLRPAWTFNTSQHLNKQTVGATQQKEVGDNLVWNVFTGSFVCLTASQATWVVEHWCSFTTLSAVPLFGFSLQVHVDGELHKHFISLFIRTKTHKKLNCFALSRKNRHCKQSDGF